MVLEGEGVKWEHQQAVGVGIGFILAGVGAGRGGRAFVPT